MHSAELEAELDSVREEANSRINQLEGAHQDQARLAQHHTSELTTRRKEIEDLQAKLHSRSGVLADHSERAKQLQQVCFCFDMPVLRNGMLQGSLRSCIGWFGMLSNCLKCASCNRFPSAAACCCLYAVDVKQHAKVAACLICYFLADEI